MLKTNYREVLEFIAEDLGTTLDVEMEAYGTSTAMLHGCHILAEKDPPTVFDGIWPEHCISDNYDIYDSKHCVGYGDFEEEACEDYFRKLQGKTLVFPYSKNETKYLFDEEFEKYRELKKREASCYISFDEYVSSISQDNPLTREIIEVYDIDTRTIKGHTLYILYGNSIYYTYEDYFPELKKLKTGEVLRIWYYRDDTSSYGNIITKFDFVK